MNEKILSIKDDGEDFLKVQGMLPALIDDDKMSIYSKASSRYKNQVVNSKMINKDHRSLTPIMFDQKVNQSAILPPAYRKTSNLNINKTITPMDVSQERELIDNYDKSLP